MAALLSRALELCACLAVANCGLPSERVSEEVPAARRVSVDRPGRPIAALSPSELARFQHGDTLFEATVRARDGLGPLYIRDACAACHAGDGRGPGLVSKAVPLELEGSVAPELLPFGPTERPYLSAGATVPLLAPRDPRLRLVSRLPPAVFGRGYLEAIADADIERLAERAQQRLGSARGRLHRLQDGRIGRFGVKARLATLEDVAADALNGDMGLTSPLRPDEPPGPEGLRDDDKPGIDFTRDQVALLGDYVRLLEIPERRGNEERGRALFTAVQCGECHVPTFTTSADHPIQALRSVEVELYTDVLLHDMGRALADGVTEAGAGPREFRTAPLIGLRFLTRLLHDGRADSVEAAIAAHGEADSEARDSVARFRALAPADHRALLAFVEQL